MVIREKFLKLYPCVVEQQGKYSELAVFRHYNVPITLILTPRGIASYLFLRVSKFYRSHAFPLSQTFVRLDVDVFSFFLSFFAISLNWFILKMGFMHILFVSFCDLLVCYSYLLFTLPPSPVFPLEIKFYSSSRKQPAKVFWVVFFILECWFGTFSAPFYTHFIMYLYFLRNFRIRRRPNHHS